MFARERATEQGKPLSEAELDAMEHLDAQAEEERDEESLKK